MFSSSFDRSTEIGGRGLGGNSSTGFGQEGQPRGSEGNLAGDAERFHIEEIEDTEDDQPLFRRPSSRRTNVSAAPSGSNALPALSVVDVLPARPQPYEVDQAEQIRPAEQHGLAAANSSQQNGGFPEEVCTVLILVHLVTFEVKRETQIYTVPFREVETRKWKYIK